MRRLKLRTGGMALRAVAVGAFVCGLVGAVTAPAAADPSDPPADAPKGEELCTVADPRLAELSGLVADGENYWAVPDGTMETAQLEIFKLDAECNILESVLPFKKSDAQPADANDPEDLGMDEKGRLWVADFGDNDKLRETIALWRVDPENPNEAELYRMSFPDGPHDAETLLLQPDGTPFVVTKDAKTALVFKPKGELENEQTTELEQVGEFTFEATNTDGGPFGPPGQLVATGGAVSEDGAKVVIRSYTDAYEWDVADGDVGKAVTGGTAPRRTALPEEPQGEAITFGADGKYVTGTESSGEDGATLYTYTPTAPPAPEDTATDSADDSGGLFSDLTLDQLILLGGGSVGALGLILAVVGVVVIVKARKRRRLEGDGDAESGDDDPDDDDDPRSRYAQAPGAGGYDRREEVYDPRDRFDEPRGYDRDPRDPRDDPYGRREDPYDRGYQPESPAGYDDRAYRPEYRDAPAHDERYAPPPAGGYRDDSGSRYEGGPAPRPDRGGAVYGGGRRDDYEAPHDPRPDFGIPRDDPRY